MEENYLAALLVSFLFGFVLLKNEKKTPEERQAIKKVLSNKNSNLSGVEKYLKNNQIITESNKKLSGVAQYLQEKEALNMEKEESLAKSTVAKYLATREMNTPVSSVSRYMAKKTIHDKKQAKTNVSGVEKYLSNRD